MAITEKTRTSKVMSMEQAASMVKDGMKLSIGGQHMCNQPNAFIREIIRRRVKDLTIIPNNAAGFHVDLLIGAECVKKLYSSYVGLDYLGMAPNFRRFAEAGKLDVVDLCEIGLLRSLKAGNIGAPFFALPDGTMACDNVRINPDWYKIIKDPFTGKDVVVVPPLRSDICVVHTAVCDQYGNAREMGYVEGVTYTATDKVIVTTDKLVPVEDTKAHYREVTIPEYIVNAVVEVPWGGHPGGSHGAGYQQDELHLKEYQKAGEDPTSMKEYLEKYIFSCKNDVEYLEKIGITRLLSLHCY